MTNVSEKESRIVNAVKSLYILTESLEKQVAELDMRLERVSVIPTPEIIDAEKEKKVIEEAAGGIALASELFTLVDRLGYLSNKRLYGMLNRLDI